MNFKWFQWHYTLMTYLIHTRYLVQYTQVSISGVCHFAMKVTRLLVSEGRSLLSLSIAASSTALTNVSSSSSQSAPPPSPHCGFKWIKYGRNKVTWGGFQLLDLIITELNSHLTCYNSMPLIGWNYSIQTGFFLTNKISTNERPRSFTSHVTFKLR